MGARSRLGAVALLAAGLCSVGATAATPKLPDLPESYIFSPSGELTPLRAGVTYRASQFPQALRVTPPSRSCTGAQWKANNFPPDEIKRRHLKCSTSPAVCRPPYFGWVAIGKGGASPAPAPRALILIMAGYDRTPSVAVTVANLRTRGTGATYDPTTTVKVAGFSGTEFDGRLVGPKHVFVPFSPPSHAAGGNSDAIETDGVGHAFRLIVLNVRGHTVVVFIGSLVMSADQFATFLPEADGILKSLRFPRGANGG